MNKDISEMEELVSYQQSVVDSMEFDSTEKIENQFSLDILIAKKRRLESLEAFEKSWDF